MADPQNDYVGYKPAPEEADWAPEEGRHGEGEPAEPCHGTCLRAGSMTRACPSLARNLKEIVSDGEAAIIKSFKDEFTGAVTPSCHNHIMEDVRREIMQTVVNPGQPGTPVSVL